MPTRHTPDEPSGRRLGMAVVRGRSMLPGLRDGDRLLMLHGGAPVPGRLVVVLLPDGVLAVKRAVRREAAGWWVARDNPAEGVDSRHVGAIPPDRVVGRVLCRIWPLWRRTGPGVSSADRGSAGDLGL